MAAQSIFEFTEFIKLNTSISYALIAILCVLLIHKLFTRKRNLPPGPLGLPIFGFLPFLGNYPYIKFEKLRKKYGDIFGLYLGQRYVLILNGNETIKEALAKPEFLARPRNSAFEAVKLARGIISSNGKEWEEQRRFIIHLLRDLGFGKSKMETRIKEEINHFLQAAENEGKQPFEMKTILASSVSNNITSLIFGERLHFEDPRRMMLDDLVTKFASFFTQSGIQVFFPWTLNLFSLLGFKRYREITDVIEKIDVYVKDEIKKHESTVDESEVRDFIDGYILQMREDKLQNKTTSFDEEMLIGNVRTLFGAGSETVKTTLDWAFLILSSFKQYQEKIQQEIDEVVGKEREPCWNDRLKMPYTQAFINETLRWRTIVPINVMRSTLEDTTFREYDIPKNTIVLTNIWSTHNDPAYWEEPEIFRPERFLNKEKNEVLKKDSFMPFSIGRRACPGESLARVELFLYITFTLQRYNVRLPEGEVHDFAGILGISYRPTPWKVCLSRRT